VHVKQLSFARLAEKPAALVIGCHHVHPSLKTTQLYQQWCTHDFATRFVKPILAKNMTSAVSVKLLQIAFVNRVVF